MNYLIPLFLLAGCTADDREWNLLYLTIFILFVGLYFVMHARRKK